MDKCDFAPGITIKPNGEDELDPCLYKEVARFRNVTVSIRECQRCGNVDVAWFRQEDTVEEPPEE